MQYLRPILMSLTFALFVTGCLIDDGGQMPPIPDGDGELSAIEGTDEPSMAFTEGDFEVSAADVAVWDGEEDPTLQCVGLPPGSYQLTCDYITVWCDGSRMEAWCRTRAGTWRYSGLNYPFSCSRGVWNDNGYLRCG